MSSPVNLQRPGFLRRDYKAALQNYFTVAYHNHHRMMVLRFTSYANLCDKILIMLAIVRR